MPCSDFLAKGSICLLCLLTLLCPELEGRSYEKCTAEDGRLGYCVAVIYCRQGQSQRLLRCPGNSQNYCCPLPAPQSSATEEPRKHTAERPRRPPADDENIFGREDRSRPSGSRYDPELDGNDERPRRPMQDRTPLGGEDRSRSSGSRYDLDGKPVDERPRRPLNDRTASGGEVRDRPSGSRYDPELDGRPFDERPRRPPNDRTSSGGEDRSRPSRPRYDTERDGKPVDDRPRRPASDRTRLDDEDRWQSRPRYDPELDGKPIDERPRRPTNDMTPLDDKDRRRPSRPRYEPEIEDKPINERPKSPANGRDPLDDEDRRLARPRYDPELDGRPVYERPRRPDTELDSRPIDERPRRPLNDRSPLASENRPRPSRPRYDSEPDGKPVDERPRADNGGPYEDRSKPSEHRYDSEPDGSPYFTNPRDVEKPRDTFGDSNAKPRDGSGRLPDSSGSRRPDSPGDANDRMPPSRDSPGPRGPEQPHRPGEGSDYDPGQARPLGPTRPDGGDSHRPKDRTGPTEQGVRGPVIRFPERHRDRKSDGDGRGEGPREDEDSKVSNGRRVDEDRPHPRPENPRRDDRPPLRDAPKANATANRTPDARAPQLPKIPGCGVRPYKLFIAGGDVSEDHQWPWMAAIFRRFPDSRPKAFLCGGSLVNTRFVLTAAHCFVNNYVILPASSFVVRLGSNHLSGGEEFTVGRLVLHHNHSGSDYFNDIALIRLAGEVGVTDKIAPICLPTHQMALADLVGLQATVAGWGDVEYRTSGTRLLQHVTIPIVSNQECSQAYSRVRGAAFLARGTDHVICAGLKEGGKDACLGDSGGPLMLEISDDQWVVIGVVSLGYKCAEPGYYGVYTRVTHYASWIEGHLRQRH